MERPRLCDRPGCGAAATASLTFDYRGRRAWLDDLAEPHPTRFELCDRHAGRVSVPLGWTFNDRRANDDVPLPGLVVASYDDDPEMAAASQATAEPDHPVGGGLGGDLGGDEESIHSPMAPSSAAIFGRPVLASRAR